ncbi:Cytochrome P450 [Penicillium expansum]|nr:Cytochrome P450 [Penicillium expansum]
MIFELLVSILQSTAFRIILVSAISTLLYEAVRAPRVYPGFSLVGVDLKDGYSRALSMAREQWSTHGKEILDQGLHQASVHTIEFYVGPKVVLPNGFADEIRNNSDFDFGAAVSADFFGSYPGFDPFALDNLIVEELADETNKAVDELFGNPETWTEITYKPKLLHLISRISSCVFIGPELCANEDWMNISTEYAVDSFIAASALRQWSFTLRPIVHWFLPECRKLRANLAQARRILKPVIHKRRNENRQHRDAGKAPSKVADTIGWMDEAAKGKPYDIEVAQLGLSLAAIHTTTEMVSGLIADLCAHAEYFEPLREEIASAVTDKGWSKKALQDLKLMDSAMKESQRHHFGDIERLPDEAAMHRMAVNSVTLSDGTIIPKGTRTMVGINQMHDAGLFSELNEYKGNRFLNMRQKPGQEHRWQFVSTSPEHLVFGHGKHACPGRFFAANEIKVVLIFLLMKYDWKFTAEDSKVDKSVGQGTDTGPTAKAMIRKRKQGLVM